MNGKPGERIEVESEAVGQPTREGEILEVIQGEVGIRYRVRWSDGHESVFSPSGGSAKIVAAEAVVRAKPSAARASGAKASGAKPKGSTAKTTKAKARTSKGSRAKR
jgi:hypothetical protein